MSSILPSDDDVLSRPGDGEELPCGASLDELFAQVTDGRPPHDPAHQDGCPHCRAALAEMRDLWSPVTDLAAETVRAPAGLLDAVLARLRELTRNPWYATLPGSQGRTQIAARVVGAIARLAAESVPQVTLALGRGRTGTELGASELAGPAGESATDVGVAGGHVVIDIQIAVAFGAPIQDVARQIRDHVVRDVHEHTGLTVSAVDVTVVDVTVVDVRRPPG